MGSLPGPWTLKFLDTNNLDPPNLGFLPTNSTPLPAALGAKQTTPDAFKISSNTMPHQRKFIIVDHSGNLTTFIFSSMQPPLQNSKPGEISSIPKATNLDGLSLVKQSSVWKDAAANQGNACHEEDADEVDALLYSNSDDNDDVRCSPGQVPLITSLPEEEVASSGGHTKRKRLNDDEGSDTTLVDIASSACGEDDLSSNVKGTAGWFYGEKGDAPLSSSNSMAKRLKRDRIHEAVCVLRGAIPGCKGETDVVTVLDEAIRYLKSLELKAKVFGIAF